MATDSYHYIGKPCVAIDAKRKVTGEAIYVADLALDNALVGKIVRSPHAHARIQQIDVSRARKVEGVRTVITAGDLADIRMGSGIYDQPILAKEVVRHVGEPVVAVAGVSERACEEALKSIDIVYEPLPAVFDEEQAIAEDQQVIVHPDLSSYVSEKHRTAGMWKGKWPPDVGRPNISGCWGLKRGDVERGFAESDLIVENKFRTAAVQHAPMEPHSVLVRPEPDGSLTVWSATRVPVKVGDVVATMLQMSPSKVRMVAPILGGSFGGKSDGHVEVITAWLALHSRAPVRLLLDREEEFVTVTKHGFTVKIKDGVSKEGILKARKLEIILNGGAYAGSLVQRNCIFAVETYKISNIEVNSYRAYTNLPIAASFRGFGITDVNTGIEQQMDIIAEKLGMDPVEFRLKNLLLEGDINNLGERVRGLGTRECLLTVSDGVKPFRERGRAAESPWKRGFGISVGMKYSQLFGGSSCEVKAHPDGSIDVFVGGMDNGQGFGTAMTQIAAEEMDTPMEKIHVRGWELGLPSMHDAGAISSHQTFNTGNAVRLALIDLKKQIFDLVYKMGEAPQELRYSNGAIYAAAGAEPLLHLSDLFRDFGGYPKSRKLLRNLQGGGELVGRATWRIEQTAIDPRDGSVAEGFAGEIRINGFYTPAAVAAEVMVNVETGEVRVVSLLCAVEGGRIVNPSLAEGEVEGAACMGLGAALMEEMYKDGVLRAKGFIDYPIPTTADMPRIESFKLFLLESSHPEGPFGAKGLGEAAIVVVPGAVANAVSNATGHRVKEIPLTPERILAALRKGKSEEKTVFSFSRPLREMVLTRDQALDPSPS